MVGHPKRFYIYKKTRHLCPRGTLFTAHVVGRRNPRVRQVRQYC